MSLITGAFIASHEMLRLRAGACDERGRAQDRDVLEAAKLEEVSVAGDDMGGLASDGGLQYTVVWFVVYDGEPVRRSDHDADSLDEDGELRGLLDYAGKFGIGQYTA